MLTAQNQTKPLVEWAESLHVAPHKLRYRMKKGWPDENVILGKAPEKSAIRGGLKQDDILFRYTPWPVEFAAELEVHYQSQRSYRDRLLYMQEFGTRMMVWISQQVEYLPPSDWELTEEEERRSKALARSSEMWGAGLTRLNQLIRSRKCLDRYYNLPAKVAQALRERYGP